MPEPTRPSPCSWSSIVARRARAIRGAAPLPSGCGTTTMNRCWPPSAAFFLRGARPARVRLRDPHEEQVLAAVGGLLPEVLEQLFAAERLAGEHQRRLERE